MKLFFLFKRYWLLCFISICFSVQIQAQQITSMEYFFDTDPGFGNGISLSILPDSNIELQQVSIDFSNLNGGLHTLFIRSKDSAGAWSLTNYRRFYKSTFPVQKVTRPIVALEYFFDNDPGFGHGIALPVSSDTSIQSLLSNISLLGLNSGNHILYLRSKDSMGNWSLTNRSSIDYCNAGTNTYYADADGDGYGNASQSVVACSMPNGYVSNQSDCDDSNNLIHQTYPFYLDQDHDSYGTGSAINVCAQGPTLPPLGYSLNATDCNDNDSNTHQLFSFYLDGDGDGYGNINQTILYCAANANDAPLGYVTDNTDCDDSNPLIYPGIIDQLEYFVDTDPSVGQGELVNISSVVTDTSFILSSINLPNNLPIGLHLLAIRAHGCAIGWGLFEQRHFIITDSNIEKGPVVEAEFFIDTDPGLGNGIPFVITTADTIDQLLSLSIPLSTAPGNHNVGIRCKDSIGQWSHFETTFIVVLAPPVPTYPLVAAEYFIDTDPGVGLATPLIFSSADTLMQTFNIAVPNSLSVGHHLLSIRVKNSQQEWGLFENRTFYVDDIGPLTNPIVAAEYFIDTDPGVGNGNAIPLIDNDTTQEVVSLNIPANLLNSSHRIAFRVKNASGQWSHFELPSIPIHLKLMLEGYYAGQGFMQPVLLNQSQGNSLLDVDTVMVELHQGTSPYNRLFTTQSVLQTDGQCQVNIPYLYQGQSCYLSIRHRNTIETWSANPLFINLYENPYDFTTSATKAHGANMIEVDNNLWALYSGDINQDENVDLIDASMLETDLSAFQFGYFASDINGDGNVDLLDLPVVESNINQFVFASHP